MAAESDEDPVVIENPERKAKRLHRHWDRLVEKVCLMMTTETRKRVEQHWDMQALMNDPKPPEATQTAQPTKTSKPRRRDDLTGIGAPLPPTARKYPVDRATCRHQDPTTMEQTLKAAGGATTNPRSGEREPFYL